MKQILVRKIDKQGRLSISRGLMELAEIKEHTKVAICKTNCFPRAFVIRKLEETKDFHVLAVVMFDEKARIVIPEELRKRNEELEIFVFNKCIFIKEVPI